MKNFAREAGPSTKKKKKKKKWTKNTKQKEFLHFALLIF